MQHKPNREKLRKIMTDYRLNAPQVASLIHLSASRVRVFASSTGSDISTANLELLQYKVGELKNVSLNQ